ncbi:hypothetical protein [Sedimenticola sp.]|uniref:hypothetical protein n=1 Tax=Sedimenticola sp. TaxID=1940285 RepID=UPI003D0E21A5
MKAIMLVISIGAALSLSACGEQGQDVSMQRAANGQAVREEEHPERKPSGVIVGDGKKFDPGSIVSGGSN